jgi:uncharacterized protein YaiI (UPF0178 family)
VPIKVWIDADGCPRPCKEMVIRAARKRKFALTLVANRGVTTPANSPNITSVQVAAGMDVADSYIVEHSSKGELVVTGDVPLAAELVEKGVQALNFRGEMYTAANVGERLSMRDFFTDARAAGIITGGGPPPYGEKDKRAFANSLDRWLTRADRANS